MERIMKFTEYINEGKKSYSKEDFINKLKSGGEEYSINGNSITIKDKKYNLDDFDKFNISSHNAYLTSDTKNIEFKL